MCNVCVCACVRGTPGCHDNSSGRVGEVRAAAWLLLRGLVEFSSGMLHNPPPHIRHPRPVLLRRATWEEDHGKEEEEPVPLDSIHR